MARITYRLDRDTGKMIPMSEWVKKYGPPQYRTKVQQVGFEEFKSPIDGRRIGDNRQLNEHNKQHGVTNIRDYSQSHYEKKAAERNEAIDATSATNKRERRETIKAAIDKHS